MSTTSAADGLTGHDRLGRTLTLLAAGAQVVAVFLPWTHQVTALDLSLRGFDIGVQQPTVGLTLVLLAALPALAALVSGTGWPRAVSGAGTGALALAWLAAGPAGAITTGITVALGAAVGHLWAAAVASGGGRPAAAPRRRDRTAAPTPGDRGGDPSSAGSGHRPLDHTADTAFEAWGPTRAACFGEAVRALVGSFADTDAVRASAAHEATFDRSGDDEDLLVDLLDEVIYLVDVRGAVPVGGDVHDRDDGGIAARFDLAETDQVRPRGAVPKAVTYHGLEVVRDDRGWRCRVTIDV